jgi:mRNA interferase YafQ
MYSIEYTRLFIKQSKLCKQRGYNIDLLEETIQLLADTGILPPKYKPHKLIGKKQDDNKLILLFTNTGTHSDIF